jgi:hypothetical protein
MFFLAFNIYFSVPKELTIALRPSGKYPDPMGRSLFFFVDFNIFIVHFDNSNTIVKLSSNTTSEVYGLMDGSYPCIWRSALVSIIAQALRQVCLAFVAIFNLCCIMLQNVNMDIFFCNTFWLLRAP